MAEPEEPLLTVKEVAARLRVHPVTVRTWLKQGKLRGARPGGTKTGWRIPASEVRRLLAGALDGERGPEGNASAVAA